MEFMGVRSSWLMRLRNSLFAWLAVSAASRARSASARACSSASSARLRSVTSRELTITPSSGPVRERVVPTDSTCRQLPSLCRKRKAAERVSPGFMATSVSFSTTPAASSGWISSKALRPSSSDGRKPKSRSTAGLW
jgi:hypothetical protein